MFPRIDSPCPARITALPQSGQDHCSLCQRQVHNLDAMTTQQRISFLQGCTGEICVAYSVQRKVNRRSAQAGLLLAAALITGQAAAQDGPEDVTEELDEIIVTGGGIRRPSEAQLIDSSNLTDIPELTNDAPELEFVAKPK